MPPLVVLVLLAMLLAMLLALLVLLLLALLALLELLLLLEEALLMLFLLLLKLLKQLSGWWLLPKGWLFVLSPPQLLRLLTLWRLLSGHRRCCLVTSRRERARYQCCRCCRCCWCCRCCRCAFASLGQLCAKLIADLKELVALDQQLPHVICRLLQLLVQGASIVPERKHWLCHLFISFLFSFFLVVCFTWWRIEFGGAGQSGPTRSVADPGLPAHA
jgi:hypothetical protein